MPDWSRIGRRLAEAAGRMPTTRPVMTSALGAGLGATVGHGLAPEERKRQSALLGALLGAGGGLAHPGIRKAVANFFRRQAFAYTGRAPARAGGVEKYLKSIQPHKVRHPGVPAYQRLWERMRQAAGRPAKELKPTDVWKTEILPRRRAGLSSIPAIARSFRRDPREAAKQWYRHGGRRELMWSPLWLAPTALTTRGKSMQEKKRSWAEAVGGQAGWVGGATLPIGAWLPLSMATGYLGKTLAGGGRHPGSERFSRRKQ